METNVNLNKNNNNPRGLMNFLIFTVLGVFVFFIPIIKTEEGSKVPLIVIIDLIKTFLGEALTLIVVLLVCLLCVTYVMAKFTTGFSTLKKYHSKDTYITGVLYVLAAIFSTMLLLESGPAFVLNSEVGGLAITLARSVLLTVIVAGSFVMFLTEFGFLEFVGILIEPVMRPLYRLPGRCAVDAVASFVCAPAVGVFITNKLYLNGDYTQREASTITTNFSVCSLGFFAVLTSIAGINHLLPQVIISSLIITFVMGMIVVCIPPLSNKKNIYIDGREQNEEDRMSVKFDGDIFKKAVQAAIDKAGETNINAISKGLWEVVTFAQKITAYVVSIAVIALAIATYTPVFKWIGIPIAPVLSILGLPNAAEIAPATLVGITEIALPVLLIAGQNIAEMSLFFITVLSTVQIIFFTESANAMLEADIPVNFVELVTIFLIRTVIAVPLVAIAAHILF